MTEKITNPELGHFYLHKSRVVKYTGRDGGLMLQPYDVHGQPTTASDRAKYLFALDPLKEQIFRSKANMNSGEPYKNIISPEFNYVDPSFAEHKVRFSLNFEDNDKLIFGRALNPHQDPRRGAIFAANPVADVNYARHIMRTCSSQHMSWAMEGLYLIHWAAKARRGDVVIALVDINNVHGRAINPLPYVDNMAKNFATPAKEALIQGAVYDEDTQKSVWDSEMFNRVPHYEIIKDVSVSDWIRKFRDDDLAELEDQFKESLKRALPDSLVPPEDHGRTVYVCKNGSKYHLKQHYHATISMTEGDAKARGKTPCICVV